MTASIVQPLLQELIGIGGRGFDTEQVFLVAEIVGDQLTFNAVSRSGKVVDSGVIARRHKDQPAVGRLRGSSRSNLAHSRPGGRTAVRTIVTSVIAPAAIGSATLRVSAPPENFGRRE